MNPEIIGLIAAFLTTSAFLPQVYKIWKHRITDGVSLSMYLVMFTGVSCWFAYGILLNSPSLMIANFLAGILQLCIIYFKIKIK